jgi:hypothetical protein
LSSGLALFVQQFFQYSLSSIQEEDLARMTARGNRYDDFARDPENTIIPGHDNFLELTIMDQIGRKVASLKQTALSVVLRDTIARKGRIIAILKTHMAA